MNDRFSILIDGGFFTRKIYNKIRKRPEIDDVMAEIQAISDHPYLQSYDLLRVYYYDSKPATGKLTHPISNVVTNLAETEVFRRNQAFLDKLELKANVALRLERFGLNLNRGGFP